MNLLDGVKNISMIVKQYNDLELNQQIIDLTQQALDLINENVRLTQENEELKKANDLESRIIRHDQPYITLSDDDKEIKYCASCWENNKKMIQLVCNNNNGAFQCPICETRAVYDEKKHRESLNRFSKMTSNFKK